MAATLPVGRTGFLPAMHREAAARRRPRERAGLPLAAGMMYIDGQWSLTRDEWPIRIEIEALPGHRHCDREGCLVITQGGDAGMRAHRRTVHGTARTRKPQPVQ